jgi:two-component system, OmpR family, response regulator
MRGNVCDSAIANNKKRLAVPETRCAYTVRSVSRKTSLSIVSPGGGGASAKSLRVLIADDDRDNANMLAVVLRDEGHDVIIALRGDEAFEMCRLFRPDVVIADVNMPGMSGYAIARELRERHGNLSPLLIGMSGVWTNTSDRLLGQTVGFDHYLVKPFDLPQVIGLIATSPGASSQNGTSSG